eukprot:6181100-Pleurochrysis_carterae.AAC.1
MSSLPCSILLDSHDATTCLPLLSPASCPASGSSMARQGARQGCPMGTFLSCLGFHACLMETQHAHPDVMIAAFADDDYALDPVPRALSARTLLPCASAACNPFLASPPLLSGSRPLCSAC